MTIQNFEKDEPRHAVADASPAISAPAALRNREVIAEALADVLPEQGDVLELASGTGEHVCLFADRFKRLTWQPTDVDAARLSSIAAHASQVALPNLFAPRHLDVTEPDWHALSVDAILAINLLHVAPEIVSEAVLTGAAQVLRPGGVLCLYGPFTQNGVFNTDSNRQFNDYLREQNPEWGLRDIATLDSLAMQGGLERIALRDMPANNNFVVYRFPG